MPDRLFLRPFEAGDGEAFFTEVMSHPDAAGLFGLDRPAKRIDAEEYISQRIRYYGRPHFYDFAVVRRMDGRVIGELNAAYISPDIADIGYVIGHDHRAQGYAKEAVKLLLNRLREDGIRTVFGACRRENAASAAVMKACGMQETADVSERVRARESEDDLCWYVLKKET